MVIGVARWKHDIAKKRKIARKKNPKTFLSIVQRKHTNIHFVYTNFKSS